jgi:hypothetical protein
VKLRELGLTVIVGAAVTLSVTETVCGLLEAPEEVTVMVPLWVPALRPAGFTDTLALPGVVPLPGETDSHALLPAETV